MLWTRGTRADANCFKSWLIGGTPLRTKTLMPWAAIQRFISQECERGGVPSPHWRIISTTRCGNI